MSAARLLSVSGNVESAGTERAADLPLPLQPCRMSRSDLKTACTKVRMRKSAADC